MYSDTIIVVGKRGGGKSLWSRLYTLASPRLFAYDPLAEIDNVQWVTDQKIVKLYDDGFFTLDKNFRLGVRSPVEIDAIGYTAYLAENVQFIMEEFFSVYGRG